MWAGGSIVSKVGLGRSALPLAIYLKECFMTDKKRAKEHTPGKTAKSTPACSKMAIPTAKAPKLSPPPLKNTRENTTAASKTAAAQSTKTTALFTKESGF